MTELLYRDNPYLKSCQATVAHLDPDNNTVVLDKTVFFGAGGGQPGDTGSLAVDEDVYNVTNTKFDRDTGYLVHQLEQPLVAATNVIATIDWKRRHLIMRTHTALHLLYAAIKLPVTGGNMDAGKGRLDFDMPEVVDRDEVESRLAELVSQDLSVTTKWVDWDYLDANPELVKTMAVQPPRTQAKVSLVEIDGVDIQACGGTHVKSTAEVGNIRIRKIENKGRQNRRVVIEVYDDE